MKCSGTDFGTIRGVGGLLTVLALAGTAVGAASMEEKFPVLETRTGLYTNVTVTTKAPGYIFILHASGMANIRIQDLAPDTQKELGYGAEKETKRKDTVFARALPDLNNRMKPLEQALNARLPAGQVDLELSPQRFYTALFILLAAHLFFSYCCRSICQKANSSTNLLVWIPVLQFIPLLRAAGMSGWWFVTGFVPILNLVTQVLWSLNIARARGKSIWVGVFLILPLTNLLAFVYLAFSSSAPVEEAPRYQSMSLQTA